MKFPNDLITFCQHFSSFHTHTHIHISRLKSNYVCNIKLHSVENTVQHGKCMCCVKGQNDSPPLLSAPPNRSCPPQSSCVSECNAKVDCKNKNNNKNKKMQCRLKIEMTKRRRSQKPLGRRYVGKCQVAYNKPSAAATNHIYLFAGHKEKKLLCQKQQHRSAIETIISKKMKIKNSISLANDLSI